MSTENEKQPVSMGLEPTPEPGQEELQQPKDNLVDINQAKPKGPNKADIKRMQIHEQRIARWLSAHPLTPDGFKQLKEKILGVQLQLGDSDKKEHLDGTMNAIRRNQAEEAIAREDWEKLPVSKQINRLVNVCAHQQRQINQLHQDLMNLRYNDQSISDAFEINHRGLQILLTSKGYTDQELAAAFSKADTEFNEKRQKAIKEMKEQENKSAMPAPLDAELQKLEKRLGEKSETVGAEPPSDATVFGGSPG